MLHAVIMAGGGGTRFWPRSRQRKPKQFLTLVGERTLLQQALDRLEAAAPPERTWVITAATHAAEVARQLPGLPAERIVGEPCGRDTAACIGLGAALVLQEDADALMIVTPADHVIEPMQVFRGALHVAQQMVEEHPQALVTIGIPPTYPATGYGYIQRGDELTQRQGLPVFRALRFREKPNADLAESMLAEGNYYWNSGIFAWKAAVVLEHLRANHPDMAAALERIARAWKAPRREDVFRAEYDKLAKISIDYAVMEKAKQVLIVEAPFRWDDLGSWRALERLHPQDADGNTVLADHCGVGTKDCLVAADPDMLIATVGVDNLIIVQDGNAILVADRRDEAGIKRLVETLKLKGLEKFL